MLHKLVVKYGTQMVVIQGNAVPASQSTDSKKTSLKQKEKEEEKDGVTKPQKLLLTWLVTEPDKFKKIQGIITPNEFSEGFCRTVAEMVFAQFAEYGRVNPAQIINHFENKEEQTMAASLFSTEFREEMDEAGQKKAFEDTVRKVKLAAIEAEIEVAVGMGNMERFQTLVAEKNRYKNQFLLP